MDPRGNYGRWIALTIVLAAGASFKTASSAQARTGSIVGRIKLTAKVRGTSLPSPMYPTRTVGRQGATSILVMDHPYYTVPDTDGVIELHDVPRGAHTITGWRERIGEKGTPISVEPGKTTFVNLALPVEDTP
jgi:hypothetical protein